MLLLGWILNALCSIGTIALLGYWYKKYPHHWIWEGTPVILPLLALGMIPYLTFIVSCLFGIYIAAYHFTPENKDEY